MDILLYLKVFDFFVLIIFFSSLLIGISRGLYIEIISNAIWVSAILIAWFFRYYPMEIFDNFIDAFPNFLQVNFVACKIAFVKRLFSKMERIILIIFTAL